MQNVFRQIVALYNWGPLGRKAHRAHASLQRLAINLQHATVCTDQRDTGTINMLIAEPTKNEALVIIISILVNQI